MPSWFTVTLMASDTTTHKAKTAARTRNTQGKTVWIICRNGDRNPVEIHIHPRDVKRAVAKWVAITGDEHRVYVKPSASAHSGRYNEVYS